MSAQFTPGPWQFEPRDEIDGSDVERPWIGRLAENRFVALACGDSADEAWANAHLIAAAPALLEALEFYADPEAWNQPPVKTIDHEILGPAYENQASKVRLDRGRIARAAIALAMGESA